MSTIPEEATLLKATHQGQLKIGDQTLNCAVLEDGTRVIPRSAIFNAFGRTRRGRKEGEVRAPNLPAFIDAKNLVLYISEDLSAELDGLVYLNKKGREVRGYKAEILPLLCDVYLSARNDGALTASQQPLAKASEILVRSLSKLGIIALVDEATGYQADRQKDELQKILSAYISEELLPWQKRFPNEFYQQICRLRGWNYDPIKHKRPQLIGKITNDIVYGLLPQGVLDELRKVNPINDNGGRAHKHHQFLTMDIGNPNLEKHLAQLIVLMRISHSWNDFEEKLCEAFPIYGTQLKLMFPPISANREKFNSAIEKASQPEKLN